MSAIDIDSLLGQMRQLSTQMRLPATPAAATPAAQGADFGALFKQSLAAVGASQSEAGQMAAAFERGDPGVDLGRTMVAVQKADLAFNATVQVRNRLVQAYKDIMNMPV
ncbi:flagellar hook-basal body complex protein FliE [Aerosticca soli]|jgi:flagellar hook-basal body complex protein FliE|uniref:Flagellar hook-basal body complex protein FliE n=1 Tax=Aerosticca soli TaxID=2010829 RepID=A0A2Z6E2T6_9GAMM|nr:flagellar hook-basal body complex protein FliE [Aerosticca soli]MDI3262751.1 flagellar hook-basal body complex protein FliE [Fulvimonas sp.]BBD79375.1 flagellar hook-basal body complex protein FliE [Aerosticca soli]